MPRWRAGLRQIGGIHVALACAVVAAALVVVGSMNGPGLTPDSVGYLAAARTYVATGEFRHWDGLPYVLWPPGLPLLLATAIRAGLDPQVAAVVINVVSAAGTVVLSYAIGRSVLGTSALALVPPIAVAGSFTITSIYQELWTEPLFCVLCLGALWLLVRMTATKPRPVDVVLLGVLISAACATRYIGVFLIPLATGVVVVATWRDGRLRASALGAAVIFLSSLATIAVVARNVSLDGPPFGPRSPSTYAVDVAARDILATLGSFVGPHSSARVEQALGLLLVALLVVGTLLVLRERDARRTGVLVLVLFVLAYVGAITLSALTASLTPLTARYLSPAFVPVVILACVASGRIVAWTRRIRPRGQGRGAQRLVAGVLIACWSASVLVNAVAAGRLAYAVGSHGRGINNATTRASPLAAALRTLGGDVTVITNDPATAYWVGGRYPVVSEAILSGPTTLAELRNRVRAGRPVVYADFDQPRTTQGISVADLARAGMRVDPRATFADGTLDTVSLGDASSTRTGPGAAPGPGRAATVGRRSA